MFDPFGDFETAGYLRNVERLKDLDEVKIQEHLFFEANLEDALSHLKSLRAGVAYEDFLAVHGALFAEFYPWAGRDRHMLGVGRIVEKGGTVQFEVAEQCRRAVECGLRLGSDPATMRSRPGEVMGYFAWGHPFLDGNGRAMLLVHTELCHRAGISIDWRSSDKGDYLRALTQEIKNPGRGLLDEYLRPLITKKKPRLDWLDEIKSLPGLDGAVSGDDNIAYERDDAVALARYREAKLARGEEFDG